MARIATSVYLDSDTDKRLKAHARGLGMSVSALIAELIEREISPGKEQATDVLIKMMARITALGELALPDDPEEADAVEAKAKHYAQVAMKRIRHA